MANPERPNNPIITIVDNSLKLLRTRLKTPPPQEVSSLSPEEQTEEQIQEQIIVNEALAFLKNGLTKDCNGNGVSHDLSTPKSYLSETPPEKK